MQQIFMIQHEVNWGMRQPRVFNRVFVEAQDAATACTLFERLCKINHPGVKSMPLDKVSSLRTHGAWTVVPIQILTTNDLN